ncbi:MAG: RNA polymerase sigma factor [Sodaliphilus sp.]
MQQLEIEFTRLVKEYKSTVYTVCMMFAEDSSETDDLVQEALIHLWKGFSTARQVNKTWVWRVTMNSCISIDRKKKRKKATECALTVAHENVMQADRYGSNANVQHLYQRIHALNPFDRAIVMLWLEGMTYDEIAEVMGISVKNVSVKLFRIKEQLKQMNHNGKQ